MPKWALTAILCTLLAPLLPTRTQAQTTGNSDRPEAYLAAPADPVEYYRKTLEAERLLAQQKWAEAEALLRDVTSAYPLATAPAPNHSPWGELGMALQKQGKYADAIRAYRMVIELQGPGLAYPGVSNALYEIAAATSRWEIVVPRFTHSDKWSKRMPMLLAPGCLTIRRSPQSRMIPPSA